MLGLANAGVPSGKRERAAKRVFQKTCCNFGAKCVNCKWGDALGHKDHYRTTVTAANLGANIANIATRFKDQRR